MKTCPHCKIEKLLSEFCRNKKTGGFKSWCKKCSNEAAVKNRQVNPKKTRKKQREYRKENLERIRESRRKYNKDNSEKTCLINSKSVAKKKGHAACTATVEELKASRTGKCVICGVLEKECTMKLHLDHDHETGEFRGWLCCHCNRLLGSAKDSPEVLLAAVAYLTFYKKKKRIQI